jgi:hypothetical protein
MNNEQFFIVKGEVFSLPLNLINVNLYCVTFLSVIMGLFFLKISEILLLKNKTLI